MKYSIIFKFPSRYRPERFFEALDSIYNNLSDFDNYHIAATIDSDDPTMNNSEVLDRIRTRKNISIQWGLSKSKVHAINRDMHPYGDIIIVMSDDMKFTCYGFDEIIRSHFRDRFPDLDGLLHFPDGDVKEELATMYIAGRKFYNRFGYIYHQSYKSLWCDNEVLSVAKLLNKHLYVPLPIVLHLNPAYGHLSRDTMFDEQQGHWADDEANFLSRQSKNFDLHMILLSILIPTTIDRHEQFIKLKNEFKRQIIKNGFQNIVEIKWAQDNKEISVGAKRNNLYNSATGKYSVQWDSDDWVHPEAIKMIVKALHEEPDCVTYKEHCTMDGEIKFSNFSHEYPDWNGEGNNVLSDGFHFQRTPFFKTPILTELCKKVGVADLRYSEDHDFAKRIKPLIHSEVHIEEFIYLYQHTSTEHKERYGIK